MRNFNKLLSVILAVMMVMSVIPAGATTGGTTPTWPIIPEGATLIFAEDFESGYTTDTNLLDASGSKTIQKNGKDVLKLKQPAGSGSVPTGYSAMVIDGEAAGFGAGNRVLELKNSNEPSSSNVTADNLRFEFLFDGGNKIDTTSETIEGEPNPYFGKQLVYEFDTKIANFKERQFMKLVASSDGGVDTFQKAIDSSWSLRQGPWANETVDGTTLTRPYMASTSVSASSKTSFKVVFDQTGAVDVVRTYKDGVLGYFNGKSLTGNVPGQYYAGKLIKDFVGEYYKQQASVNIGAPSGLYGFITANGANKTASAYIDNLVVYLVPSIEFDGFASSTNVNPDEGLKVKFDQPFNATTDTFKVTTAAGADVNNAIKSVTMSADKKTATVKMDFGVLEALTQYKIWVDDEFTSAAGALFYTDSTGIDETDEWIELGAFETCDKLEVAASPATGTITGYDVGDAQEVVLTFTSALDETVDIQNAFSVVDENLHPVSGLGITLNGDRTVATLDLSTLALGEGVHTIKSNDNAIYNASNIKAAISYTFDTVDYNAAATPLNIAQYISGSENDNIITVNLTAATTLTNDNIITGFEVTDLAGNPVNGLAATLDASGKVVTLDIKNITLTPGKYFIKSTENLVDKRCRTLIDPVNVAVKCVTELSDATVIIEDDFEVDYELNKNWLTGAGSTLEIPAADGGKWEITGANSHQAGFMGVVDGTKLTDGEGNPIEQFDSNVLKITPESATSLSFWRKAANASIDVAGQNKMLIYEYDAYGSISGDKKFMAISKNPYHGFQRASKQFFISTGPWPRGSDIENQKNWFARTSFLFDGSKQHVLQIVDQTKAVDSIRTYVNGEVCSASFQSVDNTYSNFGKTAYDFYGEDYAGAATLDYGNFNGIYSEFGGTGTMYIDNLKVYLVDAIAFEGIDWGTTSEAAFNPDAGMTLKFDQRIRAEELKNNLVVKDASGNTVSGAIKSVTLSADEKSAKVKLDFSRLTKFTEYDLYLSFLFRSKDGAYIARDGVVDGGDVLLSHFTTGDKLETSVDAATISGYDKGVDKTVTVTLSNALKADITDIAGLFEVTDAEENVISGLTADISADRKTITLQLSGLALGDGTHVLSTKEGVLVDDNGVAGSVTVVINTLDFVGVATPSSNIIKNYVEGTDQQIAMLLSIPTVMDAAAIANAFTVEDKNGTPVSGLVVTMDEAKKNLVLDISGLTLGAGEHTIKSTDIVVDSRGRTLDFEYKFDIMAFVANYPATISEYVPGSALDVTIALTYPLSDASAAAIANTFVVKNQYGNNVEGLGVTVSEDKKAIVLNLATLDIEGGEYTIASKTDAIVNAKGEVLPAVVIELSTSAASTGEVIEDNGVTPGSGSDLTGDFTSNVLLSENFDDAGYTRDMNWLSGSGAFVPSDFTLEIVGKGDEYVDAEVKIVKDPANPDGDNYVLKNVAGFKDATGTVIAGDSNYHKIKRALNDGVTETIPVDATTIVKLSTKVYIPTGGSAGMPTGDSGAVGNTKDTARIIALTNGGTTALNQPNLRKNSAGVAQYSSWINATDSAAGSAGTVAATLTADTWHTIDLIFGYNPKKDGSMFKSYEVWVDGTKITTLGGYYLADYATVGGMMSVLASATGGSGTTTVYYDDWTITKMNKLSTHINVAKTDVPATQDITLTITNKLTAESAQLIEEKGLVSVKDSEGNDVVATITLDNSGVNTKIVIEPTYGLKYQTQYVVEIAENYTDDRGNVSKIVDEHNNVFGGFTYAFDTAKALDTTIDVENGVLTYDADYMHLEDTFTYQMALSEAATHDIYAAVATFSEDNELLGIKYNVFNTGDTTKTFNVSSELGAKYIRLYIWDYTGGVIGRLMQIPDEVTSR